MAINYAEKYEKQVDEKFAEQSKVKIVTNEDYNFDGSETINIYSIGTSELNDYDNNASSNRYGTPSNLSDKVQKEMLSQDKSFTFIIDNKQLQGTSGAYVSGQALQRQLNEVIFPYIDTHAYSKMVAGADEGNVKTESSMTSVEEAILDGSLKLDDEEVPTEGRFLIISKKVYNALKKEMTNRLQTEMGDELRKRGIIELFDGMPVIPVPQKRIGANVDFIITHKSASVLPIKLADYFIHENPPGVNGHLIEGRVRFDCFVLNNKKKAIYVHKNA